MRLDDCIGGIDRYLNSDDHSPRLVNVQNYEDLEVLIQRFSVGRNVTLSVTDYSEHDENPKMDDLWSLLGKASGNVFVKGLTTQLKLLGENVLYRELQNFTTQTFNAHIVVLCYQCDKYLRFSDSRATRLVYAVDGTKTSVPELIFTLPKLPVPIDSVYACGVEHIADLAEKMNGGRIYVKSNKHKSNYPHSLCYIVEENEAFDLLCNFDNATNALNIKYGSEEQWIYALTEVTNVGSWGELINREFSVTTNLRLIVGSWKTFADEKKWLYFIALNMYGAGESWCLNEAISNAENLNSLLKQIYRSILSVNYHSADFWEKYNERKELIEAFGHSEDEVIDFLQMVRSKQVNAIYYLTDGSMMEKERMFELLDEYGAEMKRNEVNEIISHVYPALYDYLQPYRFQNESLKNYFQEYKYQKVINKIFPEFMDIVERQAKDREFNLWLSPRSEKIEELNKTGARLYFVDAMGVEYLSYILARCKEYNLMADIQICRCELPSITKLNKEFLEVFSDVAPDIKRLDDIKHHGEESFDYRQSKIPVHLIRELEIIDEVISDIRKRLISGSIERAYIIADHGASRLAVINEHENQWEMVSKGEHSGRCCPISDADVQSDYALEANGFWVLANYDRFRGGRKASVEVHGGATLEEVVVPIIELTQITGEYEVFITSQLPVEISFRKKAELQLFSKTKLAGVTVCVNGKRIENQYYDAEPQGNNLYMVHMPNVKTAGDYTMDVYSNNNFVTKLQFSVKKEGSSERSIL